MTDVTPVENEKKDDGNSTANLYPYSGKRSKSDTVKVPITIPKFLALLGAILLVILLLIYGFNHFFGGQTGRFVPNDPYDPSMGETATAWAFSGDNGIRYNDYRELPDGNCVFTENNQVWIGSISNGQKNGFFMIVEQNDPTQYQMAEYKDDVLISVIDEPSAVEETEPIPSEPEIPPEPVPASSESTVPTEDEAIQPGTVVPVETITSENSAESPTNEVQ